MEQEQNKAPEIPAAAPASTPGTPSAAAAPAAAAGAKIGIEDFTKVEMRVGQVKTAERVAGADKLLQLQTDAGTLDGNAAAAALAQKAADFILPQSPDEAVRFPRKWTDDMFMAASVLARVGAATKDPKYGAAAGQANRVTRCHDRPTLNCQ